MRLNKDELINNINDDNFITKVAKDFFIFYDKNTDSTIGKDELLKVMTDIAQTFYNTSPEKDAVEDQFEKIDVDKNRAIDFNEFKTFIKEYIKMLIEF